MFIKQEGKCRICGRHQRELKLPLAVDHNHKTGHIRGLLCHRCNFILGLASDNVQLLTQVIEYLKIND